MTSPRRSDAVRKCALSVILLSFTIAAASESVARKLEAAANKLHAKGITNVERLARSSRQMAAAPSYDTTTTSAYRACVPTVNFGAVGALNIIRKCEECILGPSCPPGCCATFYRKAEQIAVCGEGIGCMRLFGSEYLSLWTWEAANAYDYKMTTYDHMCKTIHHDPALGQQCGIRFGIDDVGTLVLSPCPIGTGTGFLVPSTSEMLIGPATCVEPPPLMSMPIDDGTTTPDPVIAPQEESMSSPPPLQVVPLQPAPLSVGGSEVDNSRNSSQVETPEPSVGSNDETLESGEQAEASPDEGPEAPSPEENSPEPSSGVDDDAEFSESSAEPSAELADVSVEPSPGPDV